MEEVGGGRKRNPAMHRGLDGCYYSNTADDALEDELYLSIVNSLLCSTHGIVVLAGWCWPALHCVVLVRA